METTTTTLRWAVVYLIANPDVQLKIQTEIDSIVGHDRSVTMSDKSAMPYTSAAIIELQRLANILPFNLLHKTLADTQIFDKPIPANTLVLPQISAVMSDPTVFTDPMRYDPNRFLDSDKKDLRRNINENFVAFGLGKRQCAGEELARMELFLILANLLQTYELRPKVDGAMPDLTPIYSGICYPKHYECQIVKRINR